MTTAITLIMETFWLLAFGVLCVILFPLALLSAAAGLLIFITDRIFEAAVACRMKAGMQ